MIPFKVNVGDAHPSPSEEPVPDTSHHYGYPAYGSYQIGVVAQWTFDQLSGGIFDRAGGLTLSPTGNPIYNVSASGTWVGVSPGIENNTNSYFSVEDTGSILYKPVIDNVVIETLLENS
jgi:hypothetical protein